MPSLSTLKKSFGQGGSGLSDSTLRDNMNLLLGLQKATVAGAAAGTKMNVAALRKGDTILHALVTTDAAAAAVVDDAANITIQETHAQGTITISGNPVEGETVTVGRGTYTFRAAPAAKGDVKITAGNNNQMATDLAAAITAFENDRGTYATTGTLVGSSPRGPELTAVASTNTVLVTSLTDGPGNAPAVSNSAHMTVTNNNTADVSVTCAAAVNGDTLTIVDQTGNNVVFTVRTTATVGTLTDVQLGADNNAQAKNLANAINCYQFNKGNLGVVASFTDGSAVVHVKPIDPPRGNITPFSEAATNVAMDGGGVLGGTTSGTNTGGFKSTTNLTGKTVTLEFFHKTSF